MKTFFITFSFFLLMSFSLRISGQNYSSVIIGKDTSECLKIFPLKFQTSTKLFLSKNYFCYNFISDSFILKQYFNPDSQIVCQKAFIANRLLSVIAISRDNNPVPDINLKCGNGKIRDYNFTFQTDFWAGSSMIAVLNATDIYYVNGTIVLKVDFGIPAVDTISMQHFANGKLNGWSTYFYLGKESYRRLYVDDNIKKVEFIGKGVCKMQDLFFDSLKNNYKWVGTDNLCNGKISILFTDGFYNGQLDREIFFTNGKIDSLITYRSTQFAIESKLIINYHAHTWLYYHYYPDGNLFWIYRLIFDTNPTEKDKILEFPNKGNPKFDGASTTYYQNGTIKEIDSFKNGIKDGIWIYYDESGNVTKEIIYKKDVLMTGN